MPNNKILLVILDGWGVAPDYEGNCITRASTPYYDSLINKYPNTILQASGLSIGLPEGQIGTSEVNHMTIGSGKILFQDLARINQSIKDGSFKDNDKLKNAISHAQENHSVLHLLAMVGPGGVHSHQSHLLAILDTLEKTTNCPRVALHLIADGRDVAPRSILTFLPEIELKLKSLPQVKIVSLHGRYFAMDRDHNWDRTDKSLAVLINKTESTNKNLNEAIESYYQSDTSDEFFPPIRLTPTLPLQDNDSLIFVNFRNDRTRQLTEKIIELNLSNFYFVTMTQYEPSYKVDVAFPPVEYGTTLGQVLSENKLLQYRITETEKFAHLTFFFNCKREEPYELEERIMVDSNKDVATHDQKPEMKADEIVDKIKEVILKSSPACIMTNICNADMVGHSGNMQAIIKAIETVDSSLSELVPFALSHGYTIIITADHGNAEEKIDKVTGGKLSAHTLNPVPYIHVSDKSIKLTHTNGLLSDIAPTILTLLDLPIPADMTGQSFVERTNL